MPTNYQRGRAFEYRTRNALLKRGAAFVMRAAQSKGAADLLALWPVTTEDSEYVFNVRTVVRSPWLVQCKYSISGGGRISPAERKKLIALAALAGAVPVVAAPGKNGRGVVFTDLSGGSNDADRNDGAQEGAHPERRGVE